MVFGLTGPILTILALVPLVAFPLWNFGGSGTGSGSSLTMGSLDPSMSNVLFSDPGDDGTPDAYFFTEFDTTTYEAAKSWAKYDVTCTVAPCASGEAPYTDDSAMSGCSAVTTSGGNGYGNIGCMISNSTKPVTLVVPDGTYGHSTANIDSSADDWQIMALNPGAAIVDSTFTGAGAGAGVCDGNDAAAVHYICQPNARTATAATWTAGFTAGTTSLTVASGHGLVAGDDIEVYMDTNTACEKFARLRANLTQQTDATSHYTTVASTSGANTVVIEDPLPMDYNGAGCTGQSVRAITYMERVGIVGMTYTASTLTYAEAGTQKVTMKFCRNCWFVGNKVSRNDDEWFRAANSRDVWIQGNWFDDLDETIDANTEGVRPIRSRHVVIENNRFTGANVASKIEIGSDETVFGYNRVEMAGELLSNRDEPAVFSHGFRSRSALYEGNHSDKRIEAADRFWDTNEGRFPVYANRLTWAGGACDHTASIHIGGDSPCPTPGSNCVSDDPLDADFRFSIEGDFAVVGNFSYSAMMSPSNSGGSCQPSGPLLSASNRTFRDSVERSHLEYNVFHQDRIGGIDSPPATKAGATGTIELNQNNVTSAEVAPAGWSSVTAPVSLYHNDRPSWWPASPPAGVCAWGTTKPSLGGFVDDYNGGAPTYCKLPAECYWTDSNAACAPF